MNSSPADEAATEFAYSATAASVAVARSDALLWLNRTGVEDVADRDRVVLAVSELASNAVEATAQEPIVIEYRLHKSSVLVSVCNNSANSSPPPRALWGPDDPLAARGRGLEIVDALADHLDIEKSGSSIRVTAEFEDVVSRDRRD